MLHSSEIHGEFSQLAGNLLYISCKIYYNDYRSYLLKVIVVYYKLLLT